MGKSVVSFSWKSLLPLLNTPGWKKKGPPHLEPQVERVKEVHLFSGRVRGERPLKVGKGGHCRQVGIPPSIHRR